MLDKLSSKSGLDDATRISIFGQYVPLYPGEETSLGEDIPVLAKARKKEAKLRARCELKFTDPVNGPKARYNYLSSLACLQAMMLEANGRRPFRDRLSLHQIIETSKKYNALIKLNEPVDVYQIPKASGAGWRTIQNFGPAARGAQRMVLTLLRAAYTPAPFQFTRLGVPKAIQEARRLIEEEGYTDVTEIDIVSHHPSFQEHLLVNKLPLPKAAVREIVVAASAERVIHGVSPLSCKSILHQVSLGIPQGSVCSPTVAEWSVSQLDFDGVEDAALINYADNFFLFTKSKADMELALEALRSAIAELPGGTFITKVKHAGTVQEGFPILGVWLTYVGGKVVAELTETNLKRLEDRFDREIDNVEFLLGNAKADGPGSTLRFQGIQKLIRLNCYVTSWAAAYAMCEDTHVVMKDLLSQLNAIHVNFAINQSELLEAYEPSLDRGFKPYSAGGM